MSYPEAFDGKQATMPKIAQQERRISDLTGFDVGDRFESEQQVRRYFSLETMRQIFGDAVGYVDEETGEPADNPALALFQSELDSMADAVIENRWHMIDLVAQRIADALNACGPALQGGWLAFDAQGNGGEWYSADSRPVAAIVWPVVPGPVSGRDIEVLLAERAEWEIER